MLTKNLYQAILIEPMQFDVDEINIVTGYGTSAMAFHHLEEIALRNIDIKVRIILGMCVSDGLSQSNHKGFKKLMTNDYIGKFECNYLMNYPPVHSKVYVWKKNNKPIKAFLGSANYTQTAFFNSQREVMAECDPVVSASYFEELSKESIYCNHDEAENYVTIYNDKVFRRRKSIESQIQESENKVDIIGLPKVSISLYNRDGDLSLRSGLNWGQRPEYHREPNQAYIRIPLSIARTDFFPVNGIHFTVLTDDDKVLICTRAQDYGKAIHTPQNNSLIGEYFRNRLGLENGQLITKSDVEKYGRNYLDFYKIDDETYFMDFSS